MKNRFECEKFDIFCGLFSNFDPGISAVHDSCANFSTTEFQTDRGKYQESLREIMRNYCESLHCELNDLQVSFSFLLS